MLNIYIKNCFVQTLLPDKQTDTQRANCSTCATEMVDNKLFTTLILLVSSEYVTGVFSSIQRWQ